MLGAEMNPDGARVQAMLAASKHGALRRIVTKSGDAWYWPAENGTHREGADLLGLDYHRPPGAGDIVVAD